MSSDSDRAGTPDQGGQVSETEDLSGGPDPVGGADETDKSTGAAPDQAEQPES